MLFNSLCQNPQDLRPDNFQPCGALIFGIAWGNGELSQSLVYLIESVLSGIWSAFEYDLEFGFSSGAFEFNFAGVT